MREAATSADLPGKTAQLLFGLGRSSSSKMRYRSRIVGSLRDSAAPHSGQVLRLSTVRTNLWQHLHNLYVLGMGPSPFQPTAKIQFFSRMSNCGKLF